MATSKTEAGVEVVAEAKALESGDDIVIASAAMIGDDRHPEAHPYLVDTGEGAPIHVLYLALQVVLDATPAPSPGHEAGPECILRALRLLHVFNNRTAHYIRVHHTLQLHQPPHFQYLTPSTELRNSLPLPRQQEACLSLPLDRQTITVRGPLHHPLHRLHLLVLEDFLPT
jgi:hypothetical protein